MSSSTRPMEAVWPLRNTRALSLRRKPSASIAARTLSAVSAVTPASPFTTLETVLRPTPARAATSFIVGRLAIGPRPSAGWPGEFPVPRGELVASSDTRCDLLVSCELEHTHAASPDDAAGPRRDKGIHNG